MTPPELEASKKILPFQYRQPGDKARMHFNTSLASIATTFSIAITAVAMPSATEEGKEEFAPFQRYDHRRALIAESQAIAINDAVLASTRQLSACTITNVPLGLIGEVDLELYRTSVMADDAQTVVVGKGGIERPAQASAATLWRGTVVGDGMSDVFLSDSPAGLYGWIQTAGERYVITSGDPMGDRTTIIYPSMGVASAMIEWSPFECATVNQNQPKIEDFGPQAPDDGGVAGNTCMTVQISIDTDNAFLSMFGSDEAAAQGYIETLVAGANVIFSRDVDAQLSIVYTRLWSSTDPWSSSSTSGRLNEFRDYWRSQMTSISRDTAHFLSGENLVAAWPTPLVPYAAPTPAMRSQRTSMVSSRLPCRNTPHRTGTSSSLLTSWATSLIRPTPTATTPRSTAAATTTALMPLAERS